MKSLSKIDEKSIVIEERPPHCYRRWDVSGNSYKVFYYGESIYLTKEEHDYFLRKLSEGKKIIRVGGVTLTDRFQLITKIEI